MQCWINSSKLLGCLGARMRRREWFIEVFYKAIPNVAVFLRFVSHSPCSILNASMKYLPLIITVNTDGKLKFFCHYPSATTSLHTATLFLASIAIAHLSNTCCNLQVGLNQRQNYIWGGHRPTQLFKTYPQIWQNFHKNIWMTASKIFRFLNSHIIFLNGLNFYIYYYFGPSFLKFLFHH